MESLWMINRQKAVGELTEGHEFAIKLQTHLQKRCEGDGLSSAGDFVAKVVQSFTNCLSILKNYGEGSGDVCRSPTSNQVGSPCSDNQISGSSGDKRKVPVSKDRRGGYKRRRSAETWTKTTPTPVEDGFSWRKYGQKDILNTNFPRNYFRCTHKYDQGCQATKQVQRIEENPPAYQTIYTGNHTCQKVPRESQLILDSSPTCSYLLNFQSHPTKAQDKDSFSSFPSIKKEYQDDQDYERASDYLLSSYLSTYKESEPTLVFASASGFDQGDVISSKYSCTTSPYSMDNTEDFITGSVDFGDIFHYGDEFLRT